MTNPVNQGHPADNDALLRTVLDLCDEWDAAIEPDGSVSIAPVRWMSAELRARVTPPDVDANRQAMWDTEGRTGVAATRDNPSEVPQP